MRLVSFCASMDCEAFPNAFAACLGQHFTCQASRTEGSSFREWERFDLVVDSLQKL
eukprot:m.9759 g.9759  ORF g.9759 m.9759 type:complete len:56 (-) comp3014_c0_seq1:59-226(-)